MSIWNVIWSQSGLTDDDVTINYYEESPISASVTAIYQETEITGEPPDEVTEILDEIVCTVTLSTALSGVTVNKNTLNGIVKDVFSRDIKYLIDNKEPTSRKYGGVSRIGDMPQKKLFMYSYFKEQTPEKEIAVTATAVADGNVVGSKTYHVTVININNDGAVIRGLLDKHSAMEIE